MALHFGVLLLKPNEFLYGLQCGFYFMTYSGCKAMKEKLKAEYAGMLDLGVTKELNKQLLKKG